MHNVQNRPRYLHFWWISFDGLAFETIVDRGHTDTESGTMKLLTTTTTNTVKVKRFRSAIGLMFAVILSFKKGSLVTITGKMF